MSNTDPKVLLVEDDALRAARMAFALRNAGQDVVVVRRQSEAIDTFKSAPTPYVIIDESVQGLEPEVVCRNVRAAAGRAGVYIVALVPQNKEFGVEGILAAGVDDYVLEPFDIREVVGRMRLAQVVRALQEQVKFGSDRFREFVTVDPVTRIPNQRAMERRLGELFAYHREHTVEIAVALFSVDDADSMIDVYGEESIDIVHGEIAKRVPTALRKWDVFGRLGADEFVVALPDITRGGARKILQDAREAIANEPIRDGDVLLEVTVGMGVVWLDRLREVDLGEIIHAARVTLRQAKDAGKNGFVAHPISQLVGLGPEKQADDATPVDAIEEEVDANSIEAILAAMQGGSATPSPVASAAAPADDEICDEMPDELVETELGFADEKTEVTPAVPEKVAPNAAETAAPHASEGNALSADEIAAMFG